MEKEAMIRELFSSKRMNEHYSHLYNIYNFTGYG
jgi:hypothetical protein